MGPVRGGTTAPEARPAKSGTAAGKEGGAGGAQLAEEHGVAGGRKREILEGGWWRETKPKQFIRISATTLITDEVVFSPKNLKHYVVSEIVKIGQKLSDTLQHKKDSQVNLENNQTIS